MIHTLPQVVVRAVGSVLIVDDDESVLAACARSLRREREVHITPDPAKARQIARSFKPDAAIVDLRIGDHSGIDLICDLKRLHPEIRIALLSGYLSVTVTMAAVKAGAAIVLAKPMGAREILRHIEEGTTPDHDITETPTLERVQWEHISRVVADTNGNLTHAARRLGISRQTLKRWLERKMPKR